MLIAVDKMLIWENFMQSHDYLVQVMILNISGAPAYVPLLILHPFQLHNSYGARGTRGAVDYCKSVKKNRPAYECLFLSLLWSGHCGEKSQKMQRWALQSWNLLQEAGEMSANGCSSSFNY